MKILYKDIRVCTERSVLQDTRQWRTLVNPVVISDSIK
jgi:hypothetical protein